METTPDISTNDDIVQKVVLGTLMSLLIAIAILGNLLVCIAILTESSLRTLSNLFFVSLALSDLLVASLVMPFALVNDLTESFVDWFGKEFCKLWIASDVMLSTASIINLLIISFDRYVHIKVCRHISFYILYYSKRYTEKYWKHSLILHTMYSTIGSPSVHEMDNEKICTHCNHPYLDHFGLDIVLAYFPWFTYSKYK